MRTDAEKLKFFSFAASSKKREGGEHSKKTLTIYGSRQEKRDKCESTLRIGLFMNMEIILKCRIRVFLLIR